MALLALWLTKGGQGSAQGFRGRIFTLAGLGTVFLFVFEFPLLTFRVWLPANQAGMEHGMSSMLPPGASSRSERAVALQAALETIRWLSCRWIEIAYLGQEASSHLDNLSTSALPLLIFCLLFLVSPSPVHASILILNGRLVRGAGKRTRRSFGGDDLPWTDYDQVEAKESMPFLFLLFLTLVTSR